jgi:hypothetical protein
LSRSERSLDSSKPTCWGYISAVDRISLTMKSLDLGSLPQERRRSEGDARVEHWNEFPQLVHSGVLW